MKTKSFVTSALLIACLPLTGCHKADVRAASEGGDPKVVAGRIVFPPASPQLGALVVETVKPCLNSLTRLAGRLTWDENATVRVFSPFAGRVVRVSVETGASVEQGTVLASVASSDFGQAQADARKASADLALSGKNLARLRELAAHGAAPAKDVAAAEADFARAQAEQARTSTRLAMYDSPGEGIDNNFLLKSPIGGTVVEKNINSGQEVRPDQMLAGTDKLSAPLLTITDPSRLWLQLDVAENDLALLKAGQSLSVRAASLPGRGFAAKVDSISDSLDPITRTARVRASVANPARQLKSEMLVDVDVAAESGQTFEVPAKAVFLKGEHHYLFTQVDAANFQRREVRIGGSREGLIQVVSGLESGEKVVADGAMLLEQILDGDDSNEIAAAPVVNANLKETKPL